MALKRVPGGWELRLRCGRDKGGKEVRVRAKMPELDETAAEDHARRLEAMRDLLVAAGVDGDAVCSFLRQAATAENRGRLGQAEEVAREMAAERTVEQLPKPAVTIRDVVELWLSGELHARYPTRVRPLVDTTLASTRARARRVCDVLGDIPLGQLTLEDAERFLDGLTDLAPSTRSQTAQVLSQVLKMAVLPMRLIERSPLPDGWAPGRGQRAQFQFLYPDEDRTLVRCKLISRERRWLWGFLAREGLRLNEALAATWGDVDLQRGTFNLDRTKTRVPRRWRLGDDVLKVLRRKAGEKNPSPGDKLFRLGAQPKHAAEAFRADLELCRIGRRELHETTAERRAIRVHDLRGTFVTLALAAGRSERWVMDRTGHTTSHQLQKYHRDSRFATEHEFGWLDDIHDLLYGPANQVVDPGLDRAIIAKSSLIRGGPGSASQTTVSTDPHHPADIDAASADREVTGPKEGPAKPEPDGPVPTVVHETTSAPVDPVERALALALEAAVAAGRLDLVPGIVAELGERRRAREAQPGVVSLEAARRRKNGDGE